MNFEASDISKFSIEQWSTDNIHQFVSKLNNNGIVYWNELTDFLKMPNGVTYATDMTTTAHTIWIVGDDNNVYQQAKYVDYSCMTSGQTVWQKIQIPNNDKISKIAVSGLHACGISKDYTKIYCWGVDNWNGYNSYPNCKSELIKI